MKKILTYFKKWPKGRYGIVFGLIVFVIGAIGLYSATKSETKFETTKVTLGDVIQTVSVTGTVLPQAKADLAFAKSGVISKLFVRVGDLVQTGDLLAQLDTASDEAALAVARATYDETVRGLRSEEIKVEQDKVEVAKTALINAQKEALDASRSSYVKVQGALFTYLDQFFSNPQSVNPTINLDISSYNIENNLNSARANITYFVFTPWLALLQKTSPEEAGQLLSSSKKYLTQIKTFIDDLSVVVNGLSPNYSGLSSATINTYVAAVNSSQLALSQAIDLISSAENGWQTALANYQQAQSTFSLKLAGNSTDTIAAQAARVDQAAAELAKDKIKAPLSGQVSQVKPAVGEFVSAGQVVFGVISDVYKIEAYVPEADIAKIAIGDLATTTLDAYGSNTYFMATVAMIDPSQTILDGVPTYKVTLYFNQSDPRIRPGMTANLDILTEVRHRVLRIPYRAVINDNGQKMVRLAASNNQTFQIVPVVVGLKGSDGSIEVLAGLEAGQVVVTYLKP